MNKVKNFILAVSGIFMLLGAVYLICYFFRPPTTIAGLYSIDTSEVKSVTFVREDIRGIPEYESIPLSVTFKADDPHSQQYLSAMDKQIWEWKRYQKIDDYDPFDALTDPRFCSSIIFTLQDDRSYCVYTHSEGDSLLLTDHQGLYRLEATQEINALWSTYTIRSIVLNYYRSAEPGA